MDGNNGGNNAPPPYHEAEKYVAYPPSNPHYQPNLGQPAPSMYPQFPPNSYQEAQQPPPMQQQPQPQPAAQAQPYVYVASNNAVLGPSPVSITCPHCSQQIVTQLRFTPGLLAWLLCFGICIIGCGLGCCLIPFCVDGVMDVEHHCPNCSSFLGQHKRL